MEKIRFKTTDGLDLYVEKRQSTELAGQDQPVCVIFSHGLSGSGRNWRSSVNEVLKIPGAIAVTYDLRGHGRSPGLNQVDSYTLQRLAQDLVELSDFLKKQHPDHRMVLIGLSLGAMVSLASATTRPELYDRLCLTSLPCVECKTSIARYAEPFANTIRQEGLEQAGAEFVWGATSGMRAEDALWVKQGFLEHQGVDIAFLLEEALANLPKAENIAEQIQSLNDQLQRINVYVGDQDQAAMLQRQLMHNFWGDQRPSALEERVFENGKHVLNLTSAKDFNEAIMHFLN